MNSQARGNCSTAPLTPILRMVDRWGLRRRKRRIAARRIRGCPPRLPRLAPGRRNFSGNGLPRNHDDSGRAACGTAAPAPLDDAGPAAPDVARWLLLTESDLALRDGDAHAALKYLARAHALDPDHEETRARLAELLIEQGDAADALTLPRGSTVSAALLVRRIRAASGIDAVEAAAARRELDTLLAVGRPAQERTAPHLREEGELALFVDRDAARALALARQNFALQKDTPDVRLLLGAAVAAGDKPALSELRRWLESTGFEDHVVAAGLRAAGA